MDTKDLQILKPRINGARKGIVFIQHNAMSRLVVGRDKVDKGRNLSTLSTLSTTLHLVIDSATYFPNASPIRNPTSLSDLKCIPA